MKLKQKMKTQNTLKEFETEIEICAAASQVFIKTNKLEAYYDFKLVFFVQVFVIKFAGGAL